MDDSRMFVGPKTQGVAADLLEAAEELGLPAQVVKSVADGFWVPQEVADLYLENAGGDWVVAEYEDGTPVEVDEDGAPQPRSFDEPEPEPKPKASPKKSAQKKEA